MWDTQVIFLVPDFNQPLCIFGEWNQWERFSLSLAFSQRFFQTEFLINSSICIREIHFMCFIYTWEHNDTFDLISPTSSNSLSLLPSFLFYFLIQWYLSYYGFLSLLVRFPLLQSPHLIYFIIIIFNFCTDMLSIHNHSLNPQLKMAGSTVSCWEPLWKYGKKTICSSFMGLDNLPIPYLSSRTDSKSVWSARFSLR